MTFNKFMLGVSLVAGGMAASSVWAAEGAKETIPYVFKSGEEGYKSYRIPAIVPLGGDNLLAFAEGRKNNWHDFGDIDVVSKRSTDGGKTWSELQIIADSGNIPSRNQTPIVLEDGTILLLYIVSDAHEGALMDKKGNNRFFSRTSTDGGKTWSEATELTNQLDKEAWGWYAIGPGNAIQIKEGKHKGRILIPANHSMKNEEGKSIYYAHTLFSDDLGKTWSFGASGEPGTNETTIAEVAPDLLVQNMRMQTHGKRLRTVRYSQDGGETWTPLEHDANLPCPVCQGSIIRDYSAPNKLIFSNPDSTHGRKNMTVRMSDNGGKSWDKSVVVWAGPAGYSNVVDMGERIGVLYEAGYEDLAEGIAFKVFKKSELKEKAPTEKK